MSSAELVDAAYAADPVACWVFLVGCCAIAGAFVFRRGGVNARFIIQVFAALATIGALPKIVLWVIASMMPGAIYEKLSGTDIVLLSGGLIAVLYTITQELLDIFSGASSEPSVATRWLDTARPYLPDFPRVLRRPTPGQPVEETENAREARSAKRDG